MLQGGYRILHHLGLEAFVAASFDEFLNEAEAFAGQTKHLTMIRRAWCTTMSAGFLCEVRGLARSIGWSFGRGSWARVGARHWHPVWNTQELELRTRLRTRVTKGFGICMILPWPVQRICLVGLRRSYTARRPMNWHRQMPGYAHFTVVISLMRAEWKKGSHSWTGRSI